MDQKPVESVLREKRIGEIINPKLVQGAPRLTVRQVISAMQENKSGYMVIADKRKVVGIFTEVDMVRKILGQDVNWDSPISEFMTKDPIVLSPNDSVVKAIELMGQHRFYHIPLVDQNNELTNVISVRTLIRFLAEFYPTEVYNLPPKPDQVLESREGG